MAEDSNILAKRLAAHMRANLPAIGAADVLAGLIGVVPRTARAYLDAHWPGARQWRAIVHAFGADCVRAVFDPEIDKVRADLIAKLRALEGEADGVRADLRSLDGPPNSLSVAENASASVAPRKRGRAA